MCLNDREVSNVDRIPDSPSLTAVPTEERVRVEIGGVGERIADLQMRLRKLVGPDASPIEEIVSSQTAAVTFSLAVDLPLPSLEPLRERLDLEAAEILPGYLVKAWVLRPREPGEPRHTALHRIVIQ